MSVITNGLFLGKTTSGRGFRRNRIRRNTLCQNTLLYLCQSVLSVISAWEIQIKQQLKRLTLHIPLSEIIRVQQGDNNLQLLPVELHHVYALDELPLHHNDPFDRLLIAQARSEKAVLVSADRAIGAYSDEVELLW